MHVPRRKAAADDDRNPPSPASTRRPPARPGRRRVDGGAGGAIRVALSTSEAVRMQHGHTLTWIDNAPPDAVVFAETREDVIDAVRDLRRPRRADRAVRRRHFARRPRQRAARRRLDRLLAHEPGARRPRRRSRLRRRARRHPQGAQRASARHRAVLSRSTPAPTPRSAAWRRRAPPAPTRCATAR